MEESATNPQTRHDPVGATSASASTLHRVRLAIASRVLESAGATLVFGKGDHSAIQPTGFVLRIPRRAGVPAR
jgi:hypothetical protein